MDRYEPVFEAPETMGLLDTKVGQRVNLITNFRVVEKTKNYIVLRIESLSQIESKRRY